MSVKTRLTRVRGEKNPSNEKWGDKGFSCPPGPAKAALPLSLPQQGGTHLLRPCVGVFFSLPSGSSSLVQMECVQGPAEPCERCRKRAGMYFPAPLGKALREQGCFPGLHHPCSNPEPPSWDGARLEPWSGVFSPSGDKFPPKWSPEATSQLRA